MEANNPQLRYRWFWMLIGYMLIVLLVYLSLTSNPVQIDTGLPYQDKLLHMLAYFSISFWFMQLYHIRPHVYFWLGFFLCLGFLMEYIQGFDSARSAEAADMVANALGIAAALLLSRTRLKFILVRFERFIT